MVCEPNGIYPSKYETEVLLKDGSRIMLRPIKKEDTEQWLSFMSRISPHTGYLRFHHTPKKMSAEDALHFCSVNYEDTFAIIAEATREQRQNIVATALSQHGLPCEIPERGLYLDYLSTQIRQKLAAVGAGMGL